MTGPRPHLVLCIVGLVVYDRSTALPGTAHSRPGSLGPERSARLGRGAPVLAPPPGTAARCTAATGASTQPAAWASWRCTAPQTSPRPGDRRARHFSQQSGSPAVCRCCCCCCFRFRCLEHAILRAQFSRPTSSIGPVCGSGFGTCWVGSASSGAGSVMGGLGAALEGAGSVMGGPGSGGPPRASSAG